jgi:hypothetical protein
MQDNVSATRGNALQTRKLPKPHFCVGHLRRTGADSMSLDTPERVG